MNSSFKPQPPPPPIPSYYCSISVVSVYQASLVQPACLPVCGHDGDCACAGDDWTRLSTLVDLTFSHHTRSPAISHSPSPSAQLSSAAIFSAAIFSPKNSHQQVGKFSLKPRKTEIQGKPSPSVLFEDLHYFYQETQFSQFSSPTSG